MKPVVVSSSVLVLVAAIAGPLAAQNGPALVVTEVAGESLIRSVVIEERPPDAAMTD